MKSLFKGFIPTKEKASQVKFTDARNFLSYESADKHPEFAGVLADDTVLIDFDNEAYGKDVYDLLVSLGVRFCGIRTTRGYHFYFKNNGKVQKCYTHKILAIGLPADIKVGLKNSYAVLKYDGKTREVLRDMELEDCDEIPYWLYPTDSKTDFGALDEGDGRNNEIYTHILRLADAGLTKEQSKDTIFLLNNMMKTPLGQKELETILRDESFPKPTRTKKIRRKRPADEIEFDFDGIAREIIKNHNVILLNHQLYIYDEGTYRNSEYDIERIVYNATPLKLTKHQRMEVIEAIKLLADNTKEPSDAKFIAFANGILDLENMQMLPFTPDLIILNKINHNYNPDAYSELGDKLLDKLSCNQKDLRSLMEEVMGYPFYRRQELRKSFLLVGDKSNGKSTYLDIITTMLGMENVTTLELKEIGDRFKTAELYGKLANIGDDIDDSFIENTAIFKKAVSGDRMNAEKKHETPFDFVNVAKLLFSANVLPRIKDNSGAVIDRLIIVPFDATFSPTDEDFDPYIKYKLRDEKCVEYFIRLGIDGLRRILKNQKFTVTKRSVEEAKDFDDDNNPINGFFEELIEDKFVMEGASCMAVYRKYQEYCIRNGVLPLSNVGVGKIIKRIFRMKSVPKKIGGKNIRIYTSVKK